MREAAHRYKGYGHLTRWSLRWCWISDLNSIGISLGTRQMCVASCIHIPTTGFDTESTIEIIPNESRFERTTPCFVSFNASDPIIGITAQNRFGRTDPNTIFDITRLLGIDYTDPSVQSRAKTWPFNIQQGPENEILIDVDHNGEITTFTVEQIASILLKSAKTRQRGTVTTNTVITVPAYFNDFQRQTIKTAAKLAGLNVVRIFNEPAAAAVAYDLHKTPFVNRNLDDDDEIYVIVFDLGGTTLDVTLLAIDDGVFEVLQTAGDRNFGGENITDILVKYFVNEFYRKNNIQSVDSKISQESMRRLYRQCERAKQNLSFTDNAMLTVEAFHDDIDLESFITRNQFECLCEAQFRECLQSISKVLEDDEKTINDIEEVILVGGCCRIPRVQSIVKEYFNGKELLDSINPEEVLAHGAAMQADLLIGTGTSSDSLFLFLSCTPMSLGIETADGIMTVFIPRNSSCSQRQSKLFTTTADGQIEAVIRIYRGESYFTKYNVCVGALTISGIPPAPRGVALIEVTICSNPNETIHVDAMLKNNPHTAQQIVIGCNAQGLSADQWNAMMRDAEKRIPIEYPKLTLLKAKQRLQSAIDSVLRVSGASYFNEILIFGYIRSVGTLDIPVEVIRLIYHYFDYEKNKKWALVELDVKAPRLNKQRDDFWSGKYRKLIGLVLNAMIVMDTMGDHATHDEYALLQDQIEKALMDHLRNGNLQMMVYDPHLSTSCLI